MSSFFVLGVFDFISVIFKYLGNILTAFINFFIYTPFMLVFIGIMLIAAFAELVFKKVAGLDTIYVGGTEFGGASDGTGHDLVYAFITDPAVQNVFWAIVGLSIVLLFIFTIVALIKSEFALDLKGSAKAPIIGRALKSLANFIIVPVTALISVIGVNFLTQSIYHLFDDTTGDSIVSKCFYVGAYNANRARISNSFATQLSTNTDFAGNKIFSNENGPFFGMEQRDVAATIDLYFVGSETTSLEYTKTDFFDNLANCADDGYINFALIFFGYPNTGNFSFFNIGAINYYYDLAQFDYLIAVGSALCMCWILLTTCLVLLKRVFELTILFLLSPAMVAIAPLDGGAAEKKWRQEFMKRLLAVIGPIFAFNMYFLLVPIFSSISLFSSSFSELSVSALASSTSGNMLGAIIAILVTFFVIFDLMFQIICVIVGMSIVKSASALLSNLLGIEDLVKAGDEAGKKAVKTGASAFKGAAALAVPAVKGAAMAMKGMKAFNKAGRLKGKVDSAKSELDVAEKAAEGAEEGSDAQKNLKIAQAKHAAAQKDLEDYETQRQEKAGKKAGRKFDRQSDAARKKESKAWDAYDKAVEEHGIGSKQAVAASEKLKKAQKEREKFGGNDLEKSKKARETAVEKAEYDELDKLGNEELTAKERKEREFGKDSKNTSMFAPMFKSGSKFSKAMDWMEAHGLHGAANKEMLRVMFNPDDASQYARRRNDFMTEIMGDKGDINKIFFNKNSRASELVEGVPESKQRSAAIEQGLSWTAKQNVDKDLKDKEARKNQEEILRRMLAEEKKDNAQMKKFLELIEEKNATNPNDYARIQELNAQIDTMAQTTGLAKEARDYYDAMKKGDEGKTEDFKKYDARMKLDAERKAQETKAADDARIEKVKQERGDKVETKVAEESSAKLARDIGKEVSQAVKDALGNGGKWGTNTNNNNQQVPDLAPLLKGLASLEKLPDIMKALEDAANQLKNK